MLIRKLFKAEMAHQVPGAYTERCHHLHGHSYKYELLLRSHGANRAHMVADFKEIKDVGIHDFFDSFDHAVMLWEKDSLAPLISKLNPERYLLVPFVPTAEMMAKAFFMVTRAIVATQPLVLGKDGIDVESVIVHETDTGYARFGLDDLKKDTFPPIHFERWVISRGIKEGWKNRTWYAQVVPFLRKGKK